MNSTLLPWRSLKTRVTLFTLAIFVVSLWVLAFFASRILREDMQRALGEQQFATVSVFANEVNSDLSDRMRALETIGREVSPAILDNPETLQALLEQRPLLELLFNAGIFVTGTDGTAIASLPTSTQRIGVNFLDRDFIAAALKEGKASIGRPVIGRQLKSPIFVMAVPLRDSQGKVIGVLAGVTDLGKPNFLDRITQSQYGKTGGYWLIAPQHKLVVTATDKSYIMQPVPAPGINAIDDQYMQGYEGFGIGVSSRGVLELSAAKGIPVAGWYLAASLPAQEAFAPIDAMLRRLMLSALLITLLAGALTWWLITRMLRQQFAPMLTASRALVTLAASDQPVPALSVTSQDEIGELIGGFNRLLETLGNREKALSESEARFRHFYEKNSSVLLLIDPTSGEIVDANPAALDYYGFPGQQLIGMSIGAINTLPPEQIAEERQKALHEERNYFLFSHRLASGEVREVEVHSTPIDTGGRRVLFSIVHDITERKQTQDALRKSEAKYRTLLNNLSAGVVVHNPDTLILFSNAAATSLLGLTEDQLLGKAAMDSDWCFLQENGTPMPQKDYPVNQVIASGEGLRNQVVGVQRPHHTEPTWVLCNSYPMHDEEGKILQVVVTFTDITERKLAEEALKEAKALTDAIVENVPLMIFLKEATDQRFVVLNQAGEDLLGFDRKNLIGKNDLDLFPPQQAAHFMAKDREVLDGEVRLLDIPEEPIMTANKGQRLLHTRKVCIQGANGTTKFLLGISEDITERKQAEARLQLSASVFEHAGEGIIITDADGTILDVNEAFTRITGYLPDEALGQNPRLLGSGRQDQAFYADMWRGLLAEGHWSGEIWNRRKDGSVFAELLTISAVRDAHGTPQHYVGLFSDITAIKEYQNQLEHLANFDALTHLPNRVLLADRLQQGMAQAKRRGQQLAVAYLDLDGFKTINDTHGHEAGDQVLITLAARMKQALREGDTLARLGGDEFVAVLIDLEDRSASLPVFTRQLAAAAHPIQVGDLSLQISASLGVTFYPQDQDIDADQLLRQADQAMYQAKVAGKNRYHLFDSEQDRFLRGQYESREHIRLALEHHEFVLYYQPKVNMRTGKVMGAEALIRWQHPEKGLLPPALFLPVIEDDALAVTLGEWVIDTALTQIERWHAAGLEMPVSVNIGARQLQQRDFVERLCAILAAHPRVNPDRLELEVLESNAVEDIAQVSRVIEACAQFGVMFALDDFGTGYSSLTYLKRLHVTQLKIDQSFVRDLLDDPDDLVIVQGVISLAAAFNRQVIAEGVETVPHGTLLLRLGCELAQGYGIARPMTAEELPHWSASWQPDPAWCDGVALRA
ncbi:MAG: EAL domain-containing protein [Pseudomonas fluorescens]